MTIAMRMAQFILANVEPILAEWEVFARSIWPGELVDAAHDPAMLRNHAEDILRAAARDMNSEQTASQQIQKSKGEGDAAADSAGVNRASELHGFARVTSGFTLWALIAEYRALRASVIRLWRTSESETDSRDLDDLTRFNEAMDQSLAEAVRSFAEESNREREAVIAVQARQAEQIRMVNGALLESSIRQSEEMERADTATVALCKAKEEAEKANRLKDDFLATLSHELRTPLTVILLWSRLLRQGVVRDAPGHAQALQAIETSADAQRQLIEDLLDISRMTSGKLALSMQDVELESVVLAAVETVRPMAAAKSVELVLTLGRRSGPVQVDPDRIRQVVWNLLNNAVKFTSAGGEVRVRVQRLADAVEIQVQDTGRGIGSDFLPYVFERFRQQDASSTRAAGGLGLGLSISRQIIELHGGTIRAESEGPGKGATFTVELPLRTTAATNDIEKSDDTAVPIAMDPSASLRGVRVLLVEDDLAARSAIQWLLKQSGAEVTAVESAAAAVGTFRTALGVQRYEVVVSDIGLPERDGYQLIRDLREIEAQIGGEQLITPAVALTAYARPEDREKALAAGFQMHVQKPVEPANLLATIARLAGRDASAVSAVSDARAS